MKQIGARQEAGRIGGIGPCGRPLCCSEWMSSFVSVATSAARYQEISLNPQKLAGQCAKLKCCMNFEVDAYVEAQKDIPSREIHLETQDATFYHFKTDVFKKEMQYSSSPNVAANIVALPVERVKEIMAINKQGIKVDSLQGDKTQKIEKHTDYENVVGQDSLTRFDKKKKNKKNRRNENSFANDRPNEARNVNPSANSQERHGSNGDRNGGNRNTLSQPKENNDRPEQRVNQMNHHNHRKQKHGRPFKPDRNNEKSE